MYMLFKTMSIFFLSFFNLTVLQFLYCNRSLEKGKEIPLSSSSRTQPVRKVKWVERNYVLCVIKYIRRLDKISCNRWIIREHTWLKKRRSKMSVILTLMRTNASMIEVNVCNSASAISPRSVGKMRRTPLPFSAGNQRRLEQQHR